jgi:hypothetical protein
VKSVAVMAALFAFGAFFNPDYRDFFVPLFI